MADYEIYVKEGKGLRFAFPYKPEIIADIKASIPGITFDRDVKKWTLPEGTIMDDTLSARITDFAKRHRFDISEKAAKYLGTSGTQISSPEVNVRYNTRDQYDRDKTVVVETTSDKKFVSVSAPYSSALTDAFHSITGAKWDRDRGKWLLPLANEKEVQDALLHIKSAFPESATQESQRMKERQAKSEAEKAEGIYSVSQGEGYAFGPHEEGGFKVGDTFRWEHTYPEGLKGKLVTVISSSKEYVREDGMSFGVGDERGYIFYAKVKLADENESKPALEAEERSRQKQQLATSTVALADYIRSSGKKPEGNNSPTGKTFLDTRTIYGGGDWFVVGDDAIWYVENNGADGDDWSRNNVRTGGAGGVGWKIPYDETIAKKLQAMAQADSELKLKKNLSKDLADAAFTKLPEGIKQPQTSTIQSPTLNRGTPWNPPPEPVTPQGTLDERDALARRAFTVPNKPVGTRAKTLLEALADTREPTIYDPDTKQIVPVIEGETPLDYANPVGGIKAITNAPKIAKNIKAAGNAVKTYPPTMAGAEARAQDEGIGIAEASQKNVQDALQQTDKVARKPKIVKTHAPTNKLSVGDKFELRQLLASIEKQEKARSSRSQLQDEAKVNAVTIDYDDPRARRWMRHPNRVDIRGIDTPRHLQPVNNGLKSRKVGRTYHTNIGGGTVISRKPLQRRRR